MKLKQEIKMQKKREVKYNTGVKKQPQPQHYLAHMQRKEQEKDRKKKGD